MKFEYKVAKMRFYYPDDPGPYSESVARDAYKIYINEREVEEAELNRLGKEGWELVTVIAYQIHELLFFKRQLPD